MTLEFERVRWFTSGYAISPTTGVVLVREQETRLLKGYTGAVSGRDEHEDIEQLIRWGARAPEGMLRGLFPDVEGKYA